MFGAEVLQGYLIQSNGSCLEINPVRNKNWKHSQKLHAYKGCLFFNEWHSGLSPQRMLHSRVCVWGRAPQKHLSLCRELREPKILSRPHLHFGHSAASRRLKKEIPTTCSHIRPCRACCLATLLGVNICGRRVAQPKASVCACAVDDDKRAQSAICHTGLAAAGEHTCASCNPTFIYDWIARAGARHVCVIGTAGKSACDHTLQTKVAPLGALKCSQLF